LRSNVLNYRSHPKRRTHAEENDDGLMNPSTQKLHIAGFAVMNQQVSL